jgi:hypothetical protein
MREPGARLHSGTVTTVHGFVGVWRHPARPCQPSIFLGLRLITVAIPQTTTLELRRLPANQSLQELSCNLF